MEENQPAPGKTKKVMLLLKKGVTKLKAVPAKLVACCVGGMAAECGRQALSAALSSEGDN